MTLDPFDGMEGHAELVDTHEVQQRDVKPILMEYDWEYIDAPEARGLANWLIRAADEVEGR